jgi:hypothetical protein
MERVQVSSASPAPISSKSLKIGLTVAAVANPFTWAAASLITESSPVVALFGKNFLVMFSLFKILELTALFVGYFAAESLRKRAKAGTLPAKPTE